MGSSVAMIAESYRRTHRQVLDLMEPVSDEGMAWRAGHSSPSIAFHLWHTGRWADFLQEVLNGSGSQLWEREGFAERWKLRKGSLGYADTGMGLDDEAAAVLALPDKAMLLEYVRQAFVEAEQAVDRVDERRLESLYSGPRAAEYFGGGLSLGHIILRSLRHENRHLGMIEGLLGLPGRPK